VWQALVNAVHRGVKVRVLTNNYEDKVCHLMMTPLIYLQLAGAQVNYYRTTAFTHVKYVNADNLTSAVSSINYSKTSFIHNREAGIVIANDNSGELIGFLQAVYEYDFKEGLPFVLPYNYTQMDYDIVNDKRPIPISPPNYPTYKCKVASPAPVAIHGRASVKIITSPDFAFDNTIVPLNNVSKSLWVSIYQITDDYICNQMIELSKRIDLRVCNDVFCCFVCFKQRLTSYVFVCSLDFRKWSNLRRIRCSRSSKVLPTPSRSKHSHP